MQVESYLKKYQPVIYKSFLNSLQNDHLSHAYLISGNPGAPLLDVAKFLAKSILCDDPSPLACNSCITCLRVDDNNYPDFLVFDGSKDTIKKNNVSAIESQFEKKAFEAKGIMIYVLHLVENMTIEAVNSILKFLEEPGYKVYAFLTTNNENSILPTILSRCQIMRLKQVDRKEVISDAIDLNVTESDAELLSYLYNNPELIKEVLGNTSNNNDYQDAKTAFLDLIDALSKKDKRQAIYYTQHDIVPLVKTKQSARFFLDILAEAFEDMLALKNNKENYLKSYESQLSELANSLTNIEKKLLEIMKDRNLLNLNVNIALLIDHMILSIVKEEE